MRGALNCVFFMNGKCINILAPSRMFGRKPECIIWDNIDRRIKECALREYFPNIRKESVESK